MDLDGYEDLLISNGHGHDMTVPTRFRPLPIGSEPGGLQRADGFVPIPRLATARRGFSKCGRVGFEEVGREWGFGEEG